MVDITCNFSYNCIAEFLYYTLKELTMGQEKQNKEAKKIEKLYEQVQKLEAEGKKEEAKKVRQQLQQYALFD